MSENWLNVSKILKLNETDVSFLNNELKNGAVLCFVTDTVWGLGCLPECREGVDKIYEIKGRDRSKPLILMSDKAQNLTKYFKTIPESAQNAVKEHFPGALTVICEKSEICPDYLTSGMNTVGIRVPDNRVFSSLCGRIEGHVLATTSANKSGEQPVSDIKEALKLGADYIIDNEGLMPEGVSSTVAIFTSDGFKILRQGSVFL